MSNEKIKGNIEQHGWHFVFVFDAKGQHEDFSYTIGLEENYNHPEILVFGLKKESAHAILSDIVEEIKAGAKMELNRKIGNVIGGSFEVLFMSIISSSYNQYLGAAVGYYQKPFRAQVMFWPDQKNVLPTEEGCELTIQDEALEIV